MRCFWSVKNTDLRVGRDGEVLFYVNKGLISVFVNSTRNESIVIEWWGVTMDFISKAKQRTIQRLDQ